MKIYPILNNLGKGKYVFIFILNERAVITATTTTGERGKISREEIRLSLRIVKRSLITAHSEISGVADFMEMRLATEYDRTSSEEYGTVCRVLGILEEQIASISNKLIKLK